MDLHRFWSDETLGALKDIEAARKNYAPNVPTASNLWDTAPKGFDYYKDYKKFVTYGAEGFYPGAPLSAVTGVMLTKGDLETPTWYNEFVTGGPGNYGGPKGKICMWAYVGLLNYGQTYLAWTCDTHRGGKEQALFGLLDHDGTPSWKYDEFKQIAREFGQLENLGFPRFHKPEVAVAYSFDNRIATGAPSGSSKDFSSPYMQQVDSAYEPFMNDNGDAAIINVAYDPINYKLLVIPADDVMDEKIAAAIRDYVKAGGTAVMTAFSAKVDEHNQWFDTPLPGRLSDVFGIQTSQSSRASAMPEIAFDGKTRKATEGFYEVLEPRGAEVVANFTKLPDSPPAVTENVFGKGRAIYLATPAQLSILGPLVERLMVEVGVARGPVTPLGVYARVVEGRTLYVNSIDQDQVLPIVGEKHGVLSGKVYRDSLTLGPLEVELVQ